MLDAEQTSQFDQTFNAIPGIMFAGTIYAVVQAIGNLVFLLLAYEGILFERFVTSDSLVEELVSVFGTICIGGVVSFFLLLVLSAVLAVLMEIFNWTISYAIPARVAGGLVGGGAGFTLFGIPFLAMFWSWDGVVGQALFIFIGPILGTVVCHLSAWYQVRKFQFLLAAEALPEEKRSEHELSKLMSELDKSGAFLNHRSKEPDQPVVASKVHPLDEPAQPLLEPVDLQRASSSSSVQRRGRRQWTLKQSFALMAWLGVFTAIGSAMPIEAVYSFAIFGGIYGVIQLLSFGVLFCVWKRLDRRVNRVIVKFFKNHQEPSTANS